MTSINATRDVPDLLPARMLNEYAYCPRLFFLEWVDRAWAPSEDTVTGAAVHARADQPQGELSAEAGIAARSVALSSERLGLTAVIDVTEGTGGSVIPVDYKKGKAPARGAWEPDEVQACVQALLLRDAGYRCDEAVLYYASSSKRVTVLISGELVARTLELARQAREVAASGKIPPPLVDSPKCPGCSLNAICLPDEVNTLAERTVAPARRLTPSADAARPMYVNTQGAVVGASGGRFEVRLTGSVLSSVRAIDVSQICIRGNVTVTPQAMRKALADEIPVCRFSYGGWLSGMTTCPPGKNIGLRRRQYAAAADGDLAFCRAAVEGKIRNCRTLLQRNGREGSGSGAAVTQLAGIAASAAEASSMPVLLGLEGTAARIYFGQFGAMLRDDWGLEGEALARSRRPPRDPVNCLLSYLYALLVKDLTAVAWSVGFDPYLGLYHQPRYGRPALALDLMEEFRPIVADSAVITLLNTREIADSDFLRRGAGVALADRARATVLAAYERRMDTEITHPVFGYRITYRRVLEVQARLLGAYLLGEVPAYVPFTTR